jgi:hypothetical protein
MAGGILQLVAYGAEDLYITGKPEITHFKMIYRRHTQFSMETKEETFDNYGQFGNTSTITIPRNGDLIKNLYLQLVLNEITPSFGSKFAWSQYIGALIIKNIRLEIGGALISELWGEWIITWIVLNRKDKLDRGLGKMLGKIPELNTYDGSTKLKYTLYIPLTFFYNSIPLIAMQYHDIKLKLKLAPADELIVANKLFKKRDIKQVKLLSIKLLINYIYLDSDERKKIAQQPQEILIQQIQAIRDVSASQITNVDLSNFNHPIKEIVWFVSNDNFNQSKPFLYYTDKNWSNELVNASKKILLESIKIVDIFDNIRHAQYTLCEPYANVDCDNIKMFNGSAKNILINLKSLLLGNKSLLDKIKANVRINEFGRVIVEISETKITIRDLSIPLELIKDTRFFRDDPCVNLFPDVSLLMDGTVSPLVEAQLVFNGIERFSPREGNYFNYVLVDQYHENSAFDGVNVYSFALNPANYSPSGSANFSRLDSVILKLKIGDPTWKPGQIKLFPTRMNSKIKVFALGYNILRISGGLTGLAFAT